jgi:hypothetical protein
MILPEDFNSIPPNLLLLLSLAPEVNLQSLATQNPSVQFISIGTPNLEPLSNHSLLAPEGLPLAQQAFISGYSAAVLTKDWRIGLIIEADDSDYQIFVKAFRNGIVYYCGLCRLAYPPFHDYPISYRLPSAATEEDWLAASEFLATYAIETIYIFSPNPNPTVLQSLSEDGIVFLGDHEHDPQLKDMWLATIRPAPELIIRERWADLMDGRGGWMEDSPIVIENVNEMLFSQGRQRWVEETLEDLMDGFIEPGDTSQ